MRKKQVLENKLKEKDDTKQIVPLHKKGRLDKPKQFLTNCLYMINLADTMKMIVPFYWNPGKRIIDFTAGKRIIWRNFAYNHLSPCGFQHWHIDFNDINKNQKAEYHLDVRNIDELGLHWDIGVFDPPFTELKNGVESFGVRAKHLAGRAKGKVESYNQHFRRDFYFDNFTPLDKLFPESVLAINKVCNNLIIKIGDSHKNKELVSNCTMAELSFNNRWNKKSEFHLVDRISYRGNYARRGGRFPFAQAVTSYYLIFKKNVNLR